LSVVGGTDVGDLPADDIVVARRRIEALEKEVRVLETALAEARVKSELDHLTNIPNQVRLIDVFNRTLSSPNPRFCLVVIDLDDFKLINDQNKSHEDGDGALKHFAKALERQRRHNDLAVRKGGDEFAVFLSGCDLSGAKFFEKRLRRYLRTHKYITSAGVIYEIGFSLGMALYHRGDTYETMLRRADRLCYVAKEKKKR
jgi:diguanylate cyclase (GGDEF)-like protein